MKRFAFIILGVLISFNLFGQTKKDEIIIKLKSIQNWEIEIIIGESDTIANKDWLRNTELTINFNFDNDNSCIRPYLYFYPINFETYFEKKLINYLMLRADLYPPSPQIYKTDEFLILGWNLIDYDNKECCNCSELEKEIIDKLNLKIKTDYNGLYKLIKKEK